MIEIEDKFANIMTNILGIHKLEVINSARLKEDLGLDSLDAVEMIMEVEKEFNIIISDEEAIESKRVEDIINLITIKKSI
jgi:acyl carrier protein|tara:strand:- start:1604 stop:1843 length:240 start_codon:yes stop_codon:yes gene_type:complete